MAMLCRDIGLLFLCVPKTGSTAVARLLKEEFGGEWVPSEDLFDDSGRLQCSKKHCDCDDLLRLGLLSADLLRKLYVVATTRSPFDWLFSQYYYSRSIYESEGEFSARAWVKRNLELYRHAAHNDFATHLKRYWLSGARSVSWRWACRANVVLRHERLAADLQRIMSQLASTRSLEIPTVNVTPEKPANV